MPRPNIAKLDRLARFEPTADAISSIVKNKATKITPDDVLRNYEAMKEQNAKLTKMTTALSIGKPVLQKSVPEPPQPLPKGQTKLVVEKEGGKAVVRARPQVAPAKEEKKEKFIIYSSYSADEIKKTLKSIQCPKLNKRSLSKMKSKDKLLQAIRDSNCDMISIE